ncbi:MAG TPA: MBL fold metallo-hydrolase [Anaerolineales bacterium]|nr:MBL fold metallo-hydrolase [Anaerolineales bacterium]
MCGCNRSPSPTEGPVLVQPTQIQATLPPNPSATSDVPSLGSLKLYFLDVGQGDSILIVSPDGQTVLIDGGDGGTGVVQYLRDLGIQRIDLMFATHPHSDHIGGLVDVLNNFPVSKVVTSGQEHTTSVYEDFLDGIDKSGAEYVEVGRGDSVSFSNFTFEVLSPRNNSPENLNNGSLVLRLLYGKTAFLFTGDAEEDIEEELRRTNQPLDADILKVGHHGSETSSSRSFLNAVSPETAIYFAGVGNSYGHPDPKTINALTSAGATVFGTDQLGTILLTVSQDGYQVSSVQQEAIVSPVAVVPDALSTAPAISAGLSNISVITYTSNGNTYSQENLFQGEIMIKAAIDRFEENMVVIILEQDDKRVEVPHNLLPEGAREGHRILVEFDGEKVTRIVLDEDETALARERIKAKLERLRRGEHRTKAS